MTFLAPEKMWKNGVKMQASDCQGYSKTAHILRVAERRARGDFGANLTQSFVKYFLIC
jgi:hypothetical protein